MSWSGVGDWIKDNAGTGASLIGSLLTGNVPGAIAAGVSLVSSATGSNDPVVALETLKENPEAVLKLKELYFKEEDSIREHLREMTKIELEDKQKEQEETQKTIRAGDTAADKFVRWTRPGQSWCSLGAAVGYAFLVANPSTMVLGLLLTLPFTYAGLRGVDKGIAAFTQRGA